jgi:hypothetical protein
MGIQKINFYLKFIVKIIHYQIIKSIFVFLYIITRKSTFGSMGIGTWNDLAKSWVEFQPLCWYALRFVQ